MRIASIRRSVSSSGVRGGSIGTIARRTANAMTPTSVTQKVQVLRSGVIDVFRRSNSTSNTG